MFFAKIAKSFARLLRENGREAKEVGMSNECDRSYILIHRGLTTLNSIIDHRLEHIYNVYCENKPKSEAIVGEFLDTFFESKYIIHEPHSRILKRSRALPLKNFLMIF